MDRFKYAPYEKLASGGWRNEFTARMNLIDLWKRGKLYTHEYGCQYPMADIFYADFEKHKLYTGWLDQGLISISDPITGKNERHSINLFGDFMPQPTSCVKMDRNHIFVGEFGGHLTKISNFKDNLKNIKLKRYTQIHEGQITCIEWISTFSRAVVTGSSNGEVMLWDTKNDIRVAFLTSFYNSAIVSIVIDPKKYIIAGNVTGQVLIWKLNIIEMVNECKPTDISNNRYISTNSVINIDSQIHSLHYDLISETLIVAACTGKADTLLTHWKIKPEGCKKVNVLMLDDDAQELSSVSWSKERQGKSSIYQRLKMEGMLLENKKNKNSVNKRKELAGLESSIVCSADASGRVFLWNFCQRKRTKEEEEEEDYINIDSISIQRNELNGSTKDELNKLYPIKVLHIHEGPVMSILMDAFKIVTSG